VSAWEDAAKGLVELIPAAIDLGVEIAAAIRPQVNEEEWKEYGPKIKEIVDLAMSGKDISDHELARFLPDPKDFALRALQARKRAERIASGIPVV